MRSSIVITAALMMYLCGCQNAGKETTSATEKLYDVVAVVVAIDSEKNTITLDHEDIPGLMRAMKMTFPVEDSKILTGLKAGDKVDGKLKAKSDGKQMITELKKKSNS